ncbi:MAG: hypothetical protein ACYC64_11650 [Armatimonadota bacterium]
MQSDYAALGIKALVGVVDAENVEGLVFADNIKVWELCHQDLKHSLGALFCEAVPGGADNGRLNVLYQFLDVQCCITHLAHSQTVCHQINRHRGCWWINGVSFVVKQRPVHNLKMLFSSNYELTQPMR